MEVMEVLMLSPVTKRSRVQTPDECHQPPATSHQPLPRLRMLIVVLRVIVFTLSSELEPGQ